MTLRAFTDLREPESLQNGMSRALRARHRAASRNPFIQGAASSDHRDLKRG
jgi:hypothetical protein